MSAVGNRITNKTKKVDIKSSQAITGLGKLLAVATFLVPLGLALMTKVNNLSLQLSTSLDFHWPAFWFSLLITAPLILLLLNVPYLIIIKNVALRNIVNSENWVFLQQQSNQHIKQEISEENERSSIEFESYFEEILSLFFKEQKQISKLVIVVDNLDRIEAKDALKILSTLQTFLQHKNGKCTHTVYQNVWVIIPYDYDGLKSLWAGGESSDNKAPAKDSISKSFLDKNFQIRFEVPKPIFSNWLEFVNVMVQQAINSWDQKSKSDIVNILKLSRKDLNDIPTPREIKNYVNQIAIIANYTAVTVPIKSISYYTVLRLLENKSVSDIREQLINGSIPLFNHTSFLPDSIKKDISGLIFGVSSEKGYQLLLEPEIEVALKNGDSKRFEELRKPQGKEFWLVFNYHLNNQDFLDTDQLYKYSLSLKEAFSDENALEQRSFTQLVDKSIIKVNNINFPEPEMREAFIALLSICKEDTKVLSTIHAAFINAFDNYIASNTTVVLEDVKFLVEALNKIPNIDRRSLTNITAAQLGELYVFASQLKANLWIWLNADDKIFKEISSNINPGVMFSGLTNAVKYLLRSNTNGQWQLLIESIKKHIEYNNGTNANHSDESFEILLLLGLSNSSIKNLILPIVKSGQYLNLLYHKRDSSATVGLISLGYFLETDITSVSINPIGHSQHALNHFKEKWITSNEKLANDVLKYLKENGEQFDFIWKLAQLENYKLAQDIIKLAISEADSNSFFQVDDCVDALKISGLKISQVAQKIVENNNIEANLKSLTLDYLNENNKELYYLLEHSNSQHLVLQLLPLLKSLNFTIWKEALDDGNHLTDLAIKVKELNEGFILGHDFYDALIQYNFTTTEISDWQVSNWHKIVLILDEPYLEEYKSKVTDYLIENKGRASSNFLKLASSFINVATILNQKDILESIILSAIEEKDFIKLPLILKIFSYESVQTMYKANKNKITILKDRLNNLIEEDSTSESKSILLGIAALFNIKIKETKKP